jgi:hypothetical protein
METLEHKLRCRNVNLLGQKRPRILIFNGMHDLRINPLLLLYTVYGVVRTRRPIHYDHYRSSVLSHLHSNQS